MIPERFPFPSLLCDLQVMHPGGGGHRSSTRQHACCFACHAHADHHLMHHSSLDNACSLPHRGAEGVTWSRARDRRQDHCSPARAGVGIAVWSPTGPSRSPYSPTFNLLPSLHACFLRPLSLTTDVRLLSLVPPGSDYQPAFPVSWLLPAFGTVNSACCCLHGQVPSFPAACWSPP